MNCKNVNRRNKVLFNVVVAQEMPKLDRRFSLSELWYRFNLELDRYLALLCKPHHIACDGGCRAVARHGAWVPRKTEGDGRGDEWKHRKPFYLPRERLLYKPDPAPADDFLFWGSKKSKPVKCLVALWNFLRLVDTNCSFSPRGVRQRCQTQNFATS